MSDETREGWATPARPPLIAAAALLAILLTAVVLAGRLYMARTVASTRPPPIAMPAPRLETARAPPHRPRTDYVQPPPAGIDRAMAETAAQGDALWGSARP